MELGELITIYRRQEGLTIDELVEKSGVPKGTLNKIIGGVTKAPTLDNIRAIAKALNKKLDDFVEEKQVCEIDYYLSPSAYRIGRAYEKATPPVQKTVEVALEPFFEESPKKGIQIAKNDEIEIIVYDQPAAAGLGNYLDGAEYTTESFISNIVPRGTDFAIRISGDSMEPEFRDGGVVFVKSQPVIENGQVGIFILDGNSYCKKLKIDHDKKQIRLVSLNDKYRDIAVEDENDLRTVGKVLGYTALE